MAWARFDDHFHSNPKIIEGGNAVAGLFARCVTYCADYLTDGFVPRGVPWGFLSQFHDPTDLVKQVTDAGLWEEVPGGFSIPDYLEYNPSKEEVLENRRKEREKKQRSRGESRRESPKVSPVDSPEMSLGESSGTPGTGRGTEEPPTSEVELDARAREVNRLCGLLADLIEGNGVKRPIVSPRWRQSCRLLLDRDGHSEADVERVIRWCQADEFWRGNVLSMGKLREKFDQLTLKMRGSGVRSAVEHPADAAVAKWERRAAEWAQEDVA